MKQRMQIVLQQANEKIKAFEAAANLNGGKMRELKKESDHLHNMVEDIKKTGAMKLEAATRTLFRLENSILLQTAETKELKEKLSASEQKVQASAEELNRSRESQAHLEKRFTAQLETNHQLEKVRLFKIGVFMLLYPYLTLAGYRCRKTALLALAH